MKCDTFLEENTAKLYFFLSWEEINTTKNYLYTNIVLKNV